MILFFILSQYTWSLHYVFSIRWNLQLLFILTLFFYQRFKSLSISTPHLDEEKTTTRRSLISPPKTSRSQKRPRALACNLEDLISPLRPRLNFYSHIVAHTLIYIPAPRARFFLSFRYCRRGELPALWACLRNSCPPLPPTPPLSSLSI